MRARARFGERATGITTGFSRRLALAALAAGFVALATPVRAETPPDPALTKVTELETLITQHQKEKAMQALCLDAKTAAGFHKEFASREDLQKRCIGCLETVLKTVKEESDKKTVLETVGSTESPDAVRLVKPYLRQPDPEKSSPVLLCAIRVAAMIPASETVEPLLALFEDSKEMGVASAALESLGAFGKIKSKRVKILTTCTKEIERVQPGTSARPKSGSGGVSPGYDNPPGSSKGQAGAAGRWATLAPLLPKAMNQLTGQNLGSPQQWFQVVKDTTDLNSLFNA